MVPAAPAAAPTRPPIVRLASRAVGESEAVRLTISGASPGLEYVVRFRVPAVTPAAGFGCAASASLRVAGSSHRLHVGLEPGGVWCAGAGILSVALERRGARSIAVRVRVRPPQALGAGDVVGHLLVGPTCPVERVDDPCDPVGRPEPVILTALDAAGAETARTVTRADGSFALDLPPGTYTLHADRTGGAFPTIRDASVVVATAATRSHPQRVVVTGDTGIR